MRHSTKCPVRPWPMPALAWSETSCTGACGATRGQPRRLTRRHYRRLGRATLARPPTMPTSNTVRPASTTTRVAPLPGSRRAVSMAIATPQATKASERVLLLTPPTLTLTIECRRHLLAPARGVKLRGRRGTASGSGRVGRCAGRPQRCPGQPRNGSVSAGTPPPATAAATPVAPPSRPAPVGDPPPRLVPGPPSSTCRADDDLVLEAGVLPLPTRQPR